MGLGFAPFFIFFFSAMLPAGADTGTPFPIAGDQPVWLTDYAEALKLARASGKPLLVVFRCQH
jgi:hypothetical protein